MSDPHHDKQDHDKPFSEHHGDELLSEDLRQIAEVLRDGRPTLDAPAFDAIKLRAMSGAHRSTHSRTKGAFLRPRITALVTAAFLTLGTGGTLALAGNDGGGGGSGSASFHQYHPPCDHGQGKGRDHECHGHEGEGGNGGGHHEGDGGGGGNGDGHHQGDGGGGGGGHDGHDSHGHHH